MSSNPTTFQGESGGSGGIDWNDSSSLLRAEDSGLDYQLEAVRRGTFADLIAFVMTLPADQQKNYVIQKSGDRRFDFDEICALSRRADFPAP